MSLDGYIDSADVKRLPLSNDADFDRVDAVRASCDAILVGATTVRNDNPRLVIKSPVGREPRAARGRPPDPAKVTDTRRGDLDPRARFFCTGDTENLVYCPSDVAAMLRRRLGSLAVVVDAGREVCMDRVSRDLSDRGVERLMVEGGGSVHTQFLTADLADELQLVVAPFFVGDPRARRFVGEGRFPWDAGRRAVLAETRQIGDVVLLRYALSPRFQAD
jgi:5-amino-6-(5-phosphoribosylamino)uracil reductase